MHNRDHRLSLLERVAGVLREAGIPHALIGASALAAHGVTRSTLDQDLLAVDPLCLDPKLWADLQSQGVQVEIRRGDLLDPLAGLVRFELEGERPVDLVVGKFAWQGRALEKARRREGEISVVNAADLILLKLYAGGPQDAWDIQQLLATEDRPGLVAEVEKELGLLPAEAAVLWQKILQE